MSHDLAFLLGAYAAEGHTSRSNWSVILTNSVMTVLEKARDAWRNVFGLEARITRQPDRCTGLVVSSKRLVELLELLGCGSRASNKQIPSCIMNSTREHALAFLQGFALDAYTTTAGSARWAICLESKVAIDQLQNLMTRLGILTAQIGKYNPGMEKTYFELYAAGGSARQVCELVPFLEPDKARRAKLVLNREHGNNAADVIPGVDGRALYALIPRGRSGRNGRGTGRQAFTFLCDSRTKYVSRRSVERLHERGVPLPTWLVEVLEQRIHFVPVMSRSRVRSG